MEMQENNQVVLPTTEAPKSNFGKTESHEVIDLGSGLSNSNDSVFGYDVAEDDALGEYSPEEINTLPFTQMESAMLTPPDTTGMNNIVPDGVTSMIPSGAGFDFLEKYFSKRQARPVFICRGTNALVPFGATSFIRLLGTANITALNALAAVTTGMNALVPNMNTPGNYREIANWRRIFDLKNTVISYYNRSIPFTDLEASDRFALEMCYMRDVASCMLPILAKKYALDLVQHWQKAGFQYDTSKLTNLNSLSLETLNKQIFSAIADLPCLDDVMLSRLGALTRLRTLSKKSGFTPTIVMQDVTIAGPGRYKLSNVNAGSGYVTSTDFSAFTGRSALNGTTFAEWVELWLRCDLINEDVAAETLSQWLSFAQSIRTNYSILIACAQQLELKGSVKYASIGEFLPVSGVEQFKLSYKLSAPTFSYAFKERFEYAPRLVKGETVGGTNYTQLFRLTDLPAYDTSDYNTKHYYRRPVGLYKGPQCWGTKEIAQIGIFRDATSLVSGTYSYLIRANIAAALNVAFTGTQITSAGAIVADAYYGDLYLGDLNHLAATSDSDTGNLAFYSSAAELIQYYGADGSRCPNFCTLDAFISDGGTAATPLTLARGTQILSLDQYDLSDAESPALVLIPQIAQILEQLDLTLYMGNPKNDLGRVCTPVIVFTNYRGCEFDDFDLAPLDNAFAGSYSKLSIGLKSKTTARDIN